MKPHDKVPLPIVFKVTLWGCGWALLWLVIFGGSLLLIGWLAAYGHQVDHYFNHLLKW